MQAIISRYNAAQGKFKKILTILISRYLSPFIRGKVFSSCVSSAMLHGNETWAPCTADIQRLRRKDRAMICWICGVKPLDEIPSEALLPKWGLEDITPLC